MDKPAAMIFAQLNVGSIPDPNKAAPLEWLFCFDYRGPLVLKA